MATLVLTALGTAIGGPVGGAIGAVIGQGVDRALLRPARREGPRLTELAVQTSSYGTQMPRLFGTMRIAGTVIWATDLIETSATNGGGKGPPRETSFSYAASFAVLLSARPIVEVRRIWAEGRLLRGAAGDWKVATGFRLHRGGEDQAVDPLIASAEGLLAPAHRGCAYAVFEGLPLAEFGNRIPSLTFEVVADPGAVGVGAIAAALAGEVSGEVALTVEGFAAAGGSVGAVLDTLATASGAWWAPRGAGLIMHDVAGAPVALADEGVAAGARGARRTRTIAAIETIPRTVTVAHYDPARDYQAGVQRARRPGAGEREERIEVPAVLSAVAAKGIAEAAIARGEARRTRRTIASGFAAMAVAPGVCVSIDGETGVWRVVRASIEAMVTTLDLVPVTVAGAASVATSGRAIGAPDARIGATIVAAFEIPVLDDVLATAPRLTIAACGDGVGWRRAALLYTVDAGASWIAAGSTAAPAVIGRVETIATDDVVVVLARSDMALGDADAAAIERGGNMALIGRELVQFGEAVPLGAGRWRLQGLRRGQRGTEMAIGTQLAGDRFVLLEAAALRTIDLPPGVLGQSVRVLATGVGDGEPATATAVISGTSVLPPAPVDLIATVEATGGIALRWTRRSRIGWGWPGGADLPLGEERESYVATMTGVATGSATRTFETSVPMLAILASDRSAGAVRLTVRQRGTWGLSNPVTVTLP